MLTEEAGADAPEVPLNPALAGIGVGGDAIRIYVLATTNIDTVPVPDRFGDLSTELIVTPGFEEASPPRRLARVRPSPCGVSVGHTAVTAGTLGCLVDIAGRRYVLSNNHILAATNNGAIGDPIIQPGTIDHGSNPADAIATLADFEPIVFTPAAVNYIDAAVAELADPGTVHADILSIGFPANPPVPPAIGQTVAKHGRTTALSTGAIVDVSFDGYVRYGTAGTAWFENQIVVEAPSRPFSLGGDSGSLVVDNPASHPVGLLFAGDGQRTLANPIDLVLNRFGATVIDR